MKSEIADAIRLKHCPVALFWSKEKPHSAMQIQEGKWGCVMWLAIHAAKGKTAVADAKTFGCVGGGVGLGFGNQYKNFPGGEEEFCYFLSRGNEKRDGGSELAQKIKPFLRDEAYGNFLHGERYIKYPELVSKFIKNLPITEIPQLYVVFKSLSAIDLKKEKPQSIILFVNPDQLSALVVLANYGRESNENVIIPYAAGCQTIGIYPYREAQTSKPRAVVGLIDISARVYTRKQLGDANYMTFTVPLALFKEMEKNVADSFLQRHTWQSLLNKR